MMRHHLRLAWIGCCLGLGAAVAAPQQEAPTRDERKASFARALNKNQTALRQYRWKTRIEIRSGKKKPMVVLEDRWYDDKGALKRQQLTEPAAKDGKKKEKMLETLFFANSYLYMDFIELEKFFRKADIHEPSGGGPLMIELRDYLKNGDFLRVQVNLEPIRALEVHVDTFFEGDPMTVHAEFSKSTDLPNFVERTRITVPLRKLEVLIESSDFMLK
jgi:hypothetical protein